MCLLRVGWYRLRSRFSAMCKHDSRSGSTEAWNRLHCGIGTSGERWIVYPPLLAVMRTIECCVYIHVCPRRTWTDSRSSSPCLSQKSAFWLTRKEKSRIMEYFELIPVLVPIPLLELTPVLVPIPTGIGSHSGLIPDPTPKQSESTHPTARPVGPVHSFSTWNAARIYFTAHKLILLLRNVLPLGTLMEQHSFNISTPTLHIFKLTSAKQCPSCLGCRNTGVKLFIVSKVSCQLGWCLATSCAVVHREDSLPVPFHMMGNASQWDCEVDILLWHILKTYHS